MAIGYDRDLTRELEVIGSFIAGLNVSCSGCSWQLELSARDGLCLVSHDRVAVDAYWQRRSISLDNQSFEFIDQKSGERFLIERSLYKTVSCNPFKPNAKVQLFEFKNDRPVGNYRLQAILSLRRGLSVPYPPHYFSESMLDVEGMCCSVNNNGSRCCSNGIRFTYHSVDYLVYEVSRDIHEAKSLVVESLSGIEYSEFTASVRTILNVIGLITGYYCFAPFWIFTDAHEFVAYNDCLCDGGETRYHMWSMNPYWYFCDADRDSKLAQGVRSELRAVTKEQFEELLNRLDNKMFAHLFYTFQDLALHGSGLCASTKLPVYATCLEMCGKWWKDQLGTLDKKPKSELFEKEVRDRITKRIEELLDNEAVDDSERTICKKKIRNIFQSANQDLLLSAFEGCGIELNESEREYFKFRNPLLHGSDIIKSDSQEDNPRGYVEERCFGFHALIWRFIMKSVGYKGVYIDVAKRDQLFRASQSNDKKPLTRMV